jgi:hypothetical protein
MTNLKGSTVTDALRLREGAKAKRCSADFLEKTGDTSGARWDRHDADDMERRADEIMTLPTKPDVGTGGELVLPSHEAARLPALVDTVQDPDAVNAEASRARLELAVDAGCLDLAVDAAETIGAENSIEKMLAHQLAAAHGSTMRMFASAEEEMNRSRQQTGHSRRESQLSATRLNNSAARMMTSFQQGMTALHRVRHGGRQVVTVQHVNVSDGGQAVVAGKVSNTLRGRKRRGNANK